MGAALRPAFTPDTAPDVTAKACEVCDEIYQCVASSLHPIFCQVMTSPYLNGCEFEGTTDSLCNQKGGY